MKRDGKEKRKTGEIIPLFGRDEMNLVEFPFGPISGTEKKTLVVEHPVFDRKLKREVTRKLIITGSDAFGLPRPIDDQVLVGMKALTYEQGFSSREVHFSRYQLCRTLGWPGDGRAYRRLEDSLDRIAGTTLKFKDSWWDKGDVEWKSRTFHLIESVELCSRDGLDRARLKTGKTSQELCSFTWNEIVWKSFQDGFIKKLDMEMFRRVSQGRRREVPLRLYRILDKRFHDRDICKFELRKLCVGILGLSSNYSPSQMMRVLDRAISWLVECGYLKEARYSDGRRRGTCTVTFERRRATTQTRPAVSQRQRVQETASEQNREQTARRAWIAQFAESELLQSEEEAITAVFGTELERRLILEERAGGISIVDSGRIRQDYVRRYCESGARNLSKRSSAA